MSQSMITRVIVEICDTNMIKTEAYVYSVTILKLSS